MKSNKYKKGYAKGGVTKDELMEHYNFYVEDEEENGNKPLSYDEWYGEFGDELEYKLNNINEFAKGGKVSSDFGDCMDSLADDQLQNICEDNGIKMTGDYWKRQDMIEELTRLPKKVKKQLIDAYYCDEEYAKGGKITGAGKSGLDKIKKTSKDNPTQMYKVTDDNYSNIGTFFLKNGKFAKMTVSNADYDFAYNKVSLRPKRDVIYKSTEIEGKGGYYAKGGKLPKFSQWEKPITQKERDKRQETLVPLDNDELDRWIKFDRFKKTLTNKMEKLGVSEKSTFGTGMPGKWQKNYKPSEYDAFPYGYVEFTHKGKDYFLEGQYVFQSKNLKELLSYNDEQMSNRYAKGGSVTEPVKYDRGMMVNLAMEYLKDTKTIGKVGHASFRKWVNSLDRSQYTPKQAAAALLTMAKLTRVIDKVGKKNHQKFMKKHFPKGFAKGGEILSKEVFEWVEVYKRNNKEHYDNFNEEVEYEEEKIDLNNANDLPEVFFLEIRERLEEDGHSEEEIDNAIEEYFNKYYDEDKMFITKSYAKGGKIEVGNVMANTKTKTIGIVRDVDLLGGDVRTDADGVVDADNLEHYSKSKHKEYQIAPSTKKEIGSKFAKGGSVDGLRFDGEPYNEKEHKEMVRKFLMNQHRGYVDDIMDFFEITPNNLGDDEFFKTDEEYEKASKKELVDILIDKHGIERDKQGRTMRGQGKHIYEEYIKDKIDTPNYRVDYYAKGGEVKKKGNEMIMGGLAGVILGIFLNK
tara:strand:+ start:3214 stop:5445 length:2232 start_codon:yes stop_codon:yes gene_type:complete